MTKEEIKTWMPPNFFCEEVREKINEWLNDQTAIQEENERSYGDELAINWKYLRCVEVLKFEQPVEYDCFVGIKGAREEYLEGYIEDILLSIYGIRAKVVTEW